MMISACQDFGGAFDVQDVASFGLPPVSAQSKAGGACTNGLLSTLSRNPNISMGQLMITMNQDLRGRGYAQIPQLSTSHQTDLRQTPFSFTNPKPNGRTRALLIGINYIGSESELQGCINDVAMMRQAIMRAGFNPDPSVMRVLTDRVDFGCAYDNRADGPLRGVVQSLATYDNIIACLQWLTQGVQPGDSLFFHFSGHGAQQRDRDGDEKKVRHVKDVMDEAILPMDYRAKGPDEIRKMITDDVLFQMLVAPLPEGANLFCIFDCCHSGTVLDLPFIFSATNEGCQALQSGQVTSTGQNVNFNAEVAMKLVQLAAQGIFRVLGQR